MDSGNCAPLKKQTPNRVLTMGNFGERIWIKIVLKETHRIKGAVKGGGWQSDRRYENTSRRSRRKAAEQKTSSAAPRRRQSRRNNRIACRETFIAPALRSSYAGSRPAAAPTPQGGQITEMPAGTTVTNFYK
jgi:hypothetical protein